MPSDKMMSDDFGDGVNLLTRIINGSISLKLPIKDSCGTQVGFLTPITRSTMADKGIIESITKWRNNASKYFFTQFDATPLRTKNWLEQVVLPDSSRLIFLIYANTHLIGHFGFKNLNDTSAEIDNLVRGERGGHPQLIHFAEISLIRWIFSSFSIDSLYGYVVEGNWQAIELHSRAGFDSAGLICLNTGVSNLKKNEQSDFSKNNSPDNFFSEKIILHRTNFIGKGYML